MKDFERMLKMFVLNEVGCQFFSVGIDPMVLTMPQPAEQTWLAFVDALVVEHGLPYSKNKSRAAKRNVQTKNAATSKIKAVNTALLDQQWKIPLKASPDASVLYHHVLGVEQIALPFPDRRQIQGGEVDHIKKSNYAGFEKTPEGDVFKITFKKKKSSAILNWCFNEAKGRYCLVSRVMVFERSDDHARAMIELASHITILHLFSTGGKPIIPS